MGLLNGKVAIVTGAGGGLGGAYARLFAREGAAVVVNDMNGDAARATCAEIAAGGGRAVPSVGDVSSRAAGEAILDAALEAFGAVDILVNNAGILRDKSFANMSEEHWDAVVQVHLKGAFCVTQPVFRWMKDNRRGGVIVNTASSSGLGGSFGQTNYGAAKAGIWGFSNCLALEGAKYGIRVWTLCPAAATPMTQGLMTPAMIEAWSPERVAPVVLYMVSELSGARTNKTLFASGTKVMELKMVASDSLPNGPEFTAQDLAAAADRMFLPDHALDFNG
ncbi:MAG TPA: SDR family NAD(P)-dependent oxidoreductase [Burkholderiaceae bacterium]|jgi:NAD(P)-dependent dehydrogenase (short-subunit alcohol dehydrogenase family)|nr:SDR family NAD(P)-dependent oxidoreductase [Burkholderiaceae bacterium]